jgi:hypothetical protein
MKKNKLLALLFLVLTILSFSAQLTVMGPKGALIYVDNEYISTIKNGKEIISLNNGNHEILISKFGYEDYKTKFNLNKDMTLNVTLIPLSTIKFTSNVDNFTVKYNETTIYLKNNSMLKLPSNISEITLIAENYKPLTLKVNLIPFKTINLNVNFVPNGMVTIKSNPSANLYINKSLVGMTPYSTILSLNKEYNITLKKDGYLSLSKKIILTSEEPTTLNFELKKGIKLYIDSSPQNALVTINGEKMGYTPNTFTVPSGNLKIILSKIGYISKELSIKLDKSIDKKQLFFELYENTRIVKFSDSQGLQFYLDGKFIGESIEYLELDGMPHIIEILSKEDSELFFRYIINKDAPKEILLNPRRSTSVEVLSKEKILTYIGDKYAFTPSTILLDTMQKTKTIDVYYLNSKKTTTIRKNRNQTIFLTNNDNVSAVSLFTSSNYVLIYIDGKYVNRGYVLGDVLSPGTHNVTFKFSDGKSYNINISLTNYEHRVIFFSRANLVPVKLIHTKPYDIYVDDIKYSSSELDLRLEYGVHKISIFKGERKIAERFIYFTDDGKYINLDNWY